MAEWKKIIVSGSDISQLNNDSGYLSSTGTIDSASVATRATTLSPDATASFADLASDARTADSASVAARATLLSADATASFADLASNARTADSASVAARATELSVDATASFADLASDARTATSASFATQAGTSRNADSASVAARATELSADATASIADTATTASHALSGAGHFSGSFEGDGSGLTGLAGTLTVDGNTGTEDVDLIDDDLQILGTTNEIETAVTKVGNDVKVTLGLPANITVTASFADLAGDARTADSASVAARATELSADATASFADLASDARTADSASEAAHASTASVADRATELSADATASFADVAGTARNTDSASVAARATTLSADATASFADLASTVHDGNITTAKIADGDVTNDKLQNDSITFGSTAQALGTTVSTLSGLDLISATTGTFVLQVYESSSTIITSGSNIFGNDQNDIQQITGSLKQTGSFTISGSILQSHGTISGSFEGDGSGLTGLATVLTVDGDTGTQDVDLVSDDLQIIGTDNEIETAVTKVGNDVKVTVGLPDSITVTASLATNAENAQSASVAARATTLSTEATASFADLASDARTADSASVAARATELSADATASIADRATTASFADLAGDARTADSASVAARATELSVDATASFADVAGTARNTDSASVAARATTLSADATASIADTATTASHAITAVSASATVGGVLFPTTDGLVNQALVTDGAGTFTYGDIFGTGSTKKLDQSVAAATWSFQHDLNELYPIVQAYDSTGDQLIPERVESIDVNNVKLYFATDTAGVAAAMVGGMGISASNATSATSASIADEASTLSPTATASFADLASDARTADSASVAARATELSVDATASFADLASDARTATTASHALGGAGDFSGSFIGDGSGLTGVAGDFNFDGDSGATTINLLTETASFNGTDGEIETTVTANTLTIGLPDDVTIGNNLTVTNDATIAGDLVVGGSIVSASSLAVEDQFIILASGSNGAIDGGIIVNQVDDDPDGKGKAFAYDSSANRWALESNLNDTASVITPDAFMGVIQEGTATPVGGADPVYGGTNGNGTIFVDTNNNEAYIYI